MATQQFTPQRITGLVNTIHATVKKQIILQTIIRTRENQLAIRAEFGHEAPTELFVDGQLGKPLKQVERVTLTRFHLQNGVVDAAYRMLVERSPYGPDYQGHYQDDHWIFKNDVRVEHKIGGPPIDIGPHDKVVITNMRPYARKIEGGANNRFSKRLTDRRPGLSAQGTRAPTGFPRWRSSRGSSIDRPRDPRDPRPRRSQLFRASIALGKRKLGRSRSPGDRLAVHRGRGVGWHQLHPGVLRSRQ
jgi:hypothetical protein